MTGPGAATPDCAQVAAFLDERHHAFAREVGLFAGRVGSEHEEPEDDAAARRLARVWLGAIGEGGFLAPVRESDIRSICLAREALAYVSPLADAVYALQGLGTLPLLLSDNAAMQARWVEPALAGHAMAAFAMTEPDAGSDVGSLSMRARRTDEGYVLNGYKTYISNAGIADFYTVFASTDAVAGAKGISCFVVAGDAPGLRLVRPLVMSEPHPLGEIAFEDCRIDLDGRLGEEGQGFALGLKTLDRMRATVGAAACGMAARALGEAIAHAKRRRQFGKALAEFQLVQAKLAQMATDLAAARLLVYRAAWEADRGAERVTLEAAMAKAFATEAAGRIVDQAVQILGGAGVMASHPVDRLYRAVRSLRIYEGTTEIQHLLIAAQLLKRERT